MTEELMPDTQRRMEVLHRYMCAMEHGDIDTLVAVLEEGEQDQVLARMLMEVNEVYQQVDQMQAQAAEVAQVQQFLLDVLAGGKIIETEKAPVQALGKNTSNVGVDRTYAALESEQARSKLRPARPVVVQVLPARQIAKQKWYRTRRIWLVAALVAVMIALLVFPNSGVFASQLFSLFRVQQFQPVQINEQDIQTLSSHSIPTIDDLGSVTFQAGSLADHEGLTEAQAAHTVTFPLLLPRTLPQGIANTSTFAVTGKGQATFTFQSSKAQAYLARNGYRNVSIPANLDSSTFEINVNAGVMIDYSSKAQEQFMIVEMPSPVVSATGKASLQDLRNFVIALPGLPPQVAAQLKQINLLSGVLPLPIPSGVTAKSVAVHGTAGLLLTSSITTSIEQIKSFPAGSAVIWQAGGIIYALGGTISDTNQLINVANALR